MRRRLAALACCIGIVSVLVVSSGAAWAAVVPDETTATEDALRQALLNLTLNAIEFVCFVVIFVELYKHHKRHVELCLANKPNTASTKEKR